MVGAVTTGFAQETENEVSAEQEQKALELAQWSVNHSYRVYQAAASLNDLQAMKEALLDIVVEKDYLVQETAKLLQFKQQKVDIYINPHGEPLLYSDIVELVKDLTRSSTIKPSEQELRDDIKYYPNPVNSIVCIEGEVKQRKAGTENKTS